MSHWSNKAKAQMASGTFDWDDAARIYRLALIETVTAEPNPDMNFLSEVITGGVLVELVAANYARQTLAGRAVNRDDATDRAILALTDPEFADIGNVDGSDFVRGAVMYEQIGGNDASPADDHYIAWIDLPDQALNGGLLKLDWPATGLAYVA